MRRPAPRRGFVFVAAVLALIACEPDAAPRIPSIYEEHFDATCGGLPCDWTQIAGAPGAAHTTSTLLPGLRGLALEGDGVVVDGPGDAGSPSAFLGSPLEVVLQARCDATASLTIRVALTSVGGRDGAVDEAATLLEARLRPEPTWGTGGGLSGEARQALVPIVIPGTGGSPVHIESVTIRKDGPGQCEIDSLAVEQPTFDDGGFRTDGCI